MELAVRLCKCAAVCYREDCDPRLRPTEETGLTVITQLALLTHPRDTVSQGPEQLQGTEDLADTT